MTKFRIRTNDRFRDIKETSIFGKLEFIPKIFKIHQPYYFILVSIITPISCANGMFVGAAVSEKTRGQTDTQTDRQTHILDIYPCILPLLFRRCGSHNYQKKKFYHSCLFKSTHFNSKTQKALLTMGEF